MAVPFYNNIDLNGSELWNVSIQKLATAPETPFKGQLYFNTTDNKDMYDKITVKLSTNVLDLNDVELGDSIYLRVDDSTYIDYINGLYRIVEMSVDVSLEFDEDVSLTLEDVS